MKRIFLLGAVLAGLFIFGIAGASAASTKHKASGKTKVALKKVTCAWSISQQVPAADQTNSPGEVSGNMAGSAKCGKLLGSGAFADNYATDDSGNLAGKYQEWFNAGSVYGKYTLAQGDLSAPPSPDTFGAATYSGVLTIKGGTGVDAKTVGVGTLTCNTQDSVHFKCTAHLKVNIPALAAKKK